MRRRQEQAEDTPFPNGPAVIGAIRMAGHVLKKVAQDTRTRRSIRKIRDNNAVIFNVGGGVASEVMRTPEVREAAKNIGRCALISAGVVDYDPEADKMTPDWKGIGLAVLFPEVAIANAIKGAKSELPNLADEAASATPDAIRNYGAENPGAFKEVGRAALSNVREAVVLPFHVGRAALTGMVEAHVMNQAMGGARAATA